MCDVVSKILLKKPIVFQKNALFSNMCTFLSHCLETKNYHCIHGSLTSPCTIVTKVCGHDRAP